MNRNWNRSVQSSQTKYDLAEVIRLYESGLTQAEVAAQLGCHQVNISYLLRTRGIARRRAAKRDQNGPNNAMWKGTAISYKGAHQRVSLHRGNPAKCEHCGTTEEGKWYDWANISGKYHDVSDYLRLCRRCHRQYDKAKREVAA